jgi:polyhydroxybutyrate depolymerase
MSHSRRSLVFRVLVPGVVALGCSSSTDATGGGAGGLPFGGASGTGNMGGQNIGGTVSAGGAPASSAGGSPGVIGAGGNGLAANGGLPGFAGGTGAGGSAGVASGGTAGTASGGTAAAAGGAAGSSTGGAGVGGAATGGTAGAGAGGAAGSGTDCPTSQSLPVGDHTYKIMSANGLAYEYILTVPKTVAPGKKAPVNVVWHALSSSPEETRSLTNIDASAEAAGMITIFPRSPDASWDAGSCCTTIVNGKRRDETVFAKELVKDFESKVCVDTKRIYTSGFSNGGMLSQLLACKMADVFAAAAPMGSTLTIPVAECMPSRPIPILMINGTADPLVGYTATAFAGGIPVPQAFQNWATLDMCTGMPMTTLQMGKATCNTYAQCAAGTQVTLCAVDGMGHCVPGMKTESATNCLTKSGIPLGMPNNDINGIDMSTAFLMKYSLP